MRSFSNLGKNLWWAYTLEDQTEPHMQILSGSLKVLKGEKFKNTSSYQMHEIEIIFQQNGRYIQSTFQEFSATPKAKRGSIQHAHRLDYQPLIWKGARAPPPNS